MGRQSFPWSKNQVRYFNPRRLLIGPQSAGQTIKTASYAVGFLGLVVSASLFLHVSAKYVFVRCLRNSRHLQANTVIHWGIWVYVLAPVGSGERQLIATLLVGAR